MNDGYTTRRLPTIEPRAESGPTKFGDDWTGVFIRGDHAFAFAAALAELIKASDGVVHPMATGQANGLLELLQSSNENTTNQEATVKFPLGALVATRGCIAAIPDAEIQAAVKRHASGDWGDVSDEDKKANDQALVNVTSPMSFDGTRLLSSYKAADGTVFWIITEWDRSVTTVLLPEEY